MRGGGKQGDGTAASRSGLRRGRFRPSLSGDESRSLAGESGAAFGVQGSGVRHFLRKCNYPL